MREFSKEIFFIYIFLRSGSSSFYPIPLKSKSLLKSLEKTLKSLVINSLNHRKSDLT